QVSRDGGGEPLWRGDGRELFYLTLKGMLMAVELKPGDAIDAGIPKSLFGIGPIRGLGLNQYAVTRDGKRFLVMQDVPGAAEHGQMTVVLNWAATLHHR